MGNAAHWSMTRSANGFFGAQTQSLSIAGPAGLIECAQDDPIGAPNALMVICHPHPLHGGSMDHKVVHTLARAGLQWGCRALRFNFRGVGASAGAWDEGCGEVEDALAVIAAGWVQPNGLGVAFVLVQALAVAGLTLLELVAVRRATLRLRAA